MDHKLWSKSPDASYLESFLIEFIGVRSIGVKSKRKHEREIINRSLQFFKTVFSVLILLFWIHFSYIICYAVMKMPSFGIIGQYRYWERHFSSFELKVHLVYFRETKYASLIILKIQIAMRGWWESMEIIALEYSQRNWSFRCSPTVQFT